MVKAGRDRPCQRGALIQSAGHPKTLAKNSDPLAWKLLKRLRHVRLEGTMPTDRTKIIGTEAG